MEKLKLLMLTKSLGFYINFLSFVRPEKASKIAYKYFSEPRTGRLSPGSLPEILKQARQQTFAYGDNKFQTYTWHGNDNIILLVHGWESNAARWEQFIPYLQKTGSTIIALDAPAHGQSSGTEFSVPRYAEFINEAVQRFHPTTLIGHSIGGAACVFYQSRYKFERIQKMVILGAPSDLKVLIQNFGLILSLNAKTVSMLENHFVEKFKFPLDEISGKHLAKSIAIKGLIAHDIEDDVVSFSESEKIAASWKNARFIQTKGLGHSMHDDELYRQIVEFLDN